MGLEELRDGMLGGCGDVGREGVSCAADQLSVMASAPVRMT